MYLVNCAWRQKDIIREVEQIELDGIKLFKHVKSKGIRMYFEYLLPETEENFKYQCMLINKAIRNIPGWEALLINVLPVVNGNDFDGYKYLLYETK